MNKIILLIILLSGIFPIAGFAGQWEAQGAYEIFFPGNDFWDQATGGELKLIYWYQPNQGIAFTTGKSQWDVDQKTTVINASIRQSWSGDVEYIPLGLSILTRKTLSDYEDFSLTYEAGLFYFMSDSSLTLTETAQVPIGGGQTIEVIDTYIADTDDGIGGRIAASLEWFIYKNSRLFLTGGYQADLNKGEATVDWIQVNKKLELSAFFVLLGFAYQF